MTEREHDETPPVGPSLILSGIPGPPLPRPVQEEREVFESIEHFATLRLASLSPTRGSFECKPFEMRGRVLEDAKRFKAKHPESNVFFPVLEGEEPEVGFFLDAVAGLHSQGEFAVRTKNVTVYMATRSGKVVRVHVVEIE